MRRAGWGVEVAALVGFVTVDRFEHGMVVRDLAGGGRGTLLWVHGLEESGLCFERVLGCPELSSTRVRHLKEEQS